MNRETKAGDVVRSSGGVYRLYYKDDASKNTLRCMNLEKADTYGDTPANASIADDEDFVFNIGDLIESCVGKR